MKAQNIPYSASGGYKNTGGAVAIDPRDVDYSLNEYAISVAYEGKGSLNKRILRISTSIT